MAFVVGLLSLLLVKDVVRIEILKARLGTLVLAGACAHDVRLAQILLEATSV